MKEMNQKAARSTLLLATVMVVAFYVTPYTFLKIVDMEVESFMGHVKFWMVVTYIGITAVMLFVYNWIYLKLIDGTVFLVIAMFILIITISVEIHVLFKDGYYILKYLMKIMYFANASATLSVLMTSTLECIISICRRIQME